MSAPSPIELLSRIAPVSDEEAAAMFGADARERLLEGITQLPPRTRPVRRRIRRPVVIAVAAVVIAAATGAGWALSRGPARETTSIDCVIQGEEAIIDATSGDPAADCADEWQREVGTPAPPLRAYDNGFGGVTVLPSSKRPPTNWKPITSQDVALIELQESFDDEINGLSSACFNASAATAFVRQQLDRLGLVGWKVELRSNDPAPTPCVDTDIVEPTTKTITLVGGGAMQSANWPARKLTNALRPLTKECLSLPAMRSAVEQRASSLGFSQTATGDHNYELTAVRDDSRRCSALYETITGTIDLILRGPVAP